MQEFNEYLMRSLVSLIKNIYHICDKSITISHWEVGKKIKSQIPSFVINQLCERHFVLTKL